MSRRALAAAVFLCVPAGSAREVRAQEVQAPAATPTRMSCRSLFRACRDARDPDRLPLGGDAFQRGRARAEQRRVRERILGALLEVELDATEFDFEEYDFDAEVLAVDTRRNLRLWSGRMGLYPAGGDPIAFPVPPDRARQLVERHRRREVRLRIGFLLGHDDPDADPCLLRPGVPPIVRADIAYFEIVGTDGRVVAREDTQRLADAHTLAPDPGGAAASVHVTIAPPAVTGDRALAALVEAQFREGGAERLAESIRRCARTEGPTGTLVVELALEGSGRASDLRIEVDSLREEVMTSCVQGAVAGWTWPQGSRRARVRVSVPVMLTRE